MNNLKKAYELGWIQASKWAKRDDLIADIGSPAYTKDADAALAALKQPKAEVLAKVRYALAMLSDLSEPWKEELFDKTMALLSEQPQAEAVPSESVPTKPHKPLFAEAIAQHPGLKEELAEMDKTPPPNCRQRLAKEGKLHPRSSCAICGSLSPKWQDCNLALAIEGARK